MPTRYAARFPTAGSHLERYAACLSAAEINSSFYRPHRRATYARWAASVSADFRFAVKLPRSATHERRLAGCADILARFVEETEGLGSRLGVILVQLPPSLACDAGAAETFFTDLRRRTAATVACEPRHASWFAAEIEALLADLHVARVAADPPPVAGADAPGGCREIVYYRLHGAPRVYYSDYGAAALAGLRVTLEAHRRASTPAWCIFDNTALGCATANALDLAATLGRRGSADLG